VQAEHFALEIIELGPDGSFEIGSTDGPQTFTCISGELNLESAGGHIDLAVGGTGVLFANAGSVQMTSRTGARVLRGSLD
jgi:mannose-6-phosphate isomerase class I